MARRKARHSRLRLTNSASGRYSTMLMKVSNLGRNSASAWSDQPIMANCAHGRPPTMVIPGLSGVVGGVNSSIGIGLNGGDGDTTVDSVNHVVARPNTGAHACWYWTEGARCVPE